VLVAPLGPLVPLSREEPVVEKETRVTGGGRVRKIEGVEERTISESVRREDVDIDKSGKTLPAPSENR
jgi:stress response protein YsnF